MSTEGKHVRYRTRVGSRLAAASICATILLLAPASAFAAQAHYYAGESFGGAAQLSLLAPTTEESPPGDEIHKLREPGSGLAVDEQTGDVYVADTGNHRIAEFSGSGAFIRYFGWGVLNGSPEAQVCETGCEAGIAGSQPGQLDEPIFVAVDNSPGGEGDVYVGDRADDIVTKFDSEGHLVGGWADEGQLEGIPAAEGSGDLTPSRATGSGNVTLGSSLITGVSTASGAFAVGQRLSITSHEGGGGGVFTITAIGAGTLTTSQPYKGSTEAGVGLSGQMTTVSNLNTTTGAFLVGRRVTGGGIPEEATITAASGNSLLLSKAVAAAESAVSLHAAPLSFDELSGVATGPEGDLYVFASGLVFDFDGTGSVSRLIAGNGSRPAGLGLDGAPDLFLVDGLETVDRFDPTGTIRQTITAPPNSRNGDVSPFGLAVSASQGDLYVDVVGTSIDNYAAGCEVTKHSGGEFCNATQVFGEGLLDQGAGLGINPTTGSLYAASTGDDRILVFPVAIEADASAATQVSAHSATLNATVNPHGSILSSCRFEYGEGTAVGQRSIPCAENAAAIGSGTAPVSVHADVSGLEGAVKYEFRLRATNANGDVKSEEEALTTLPSPGIEGVKASEIGATSATLEARINPRGSATHYRFEYGPCASASSCGTSPYPFVLPNPEGQVGSGSAPVGVSEPIVGLSPGLTYHFRVVAINAAGTTTGTDHTFTYLPGAPIETGCGNEAVRQSNGSSALPDCRAYELVTPAKKNGSLIGALFLGQLPPQIASDGSSLIVPAIQCFAQTPSCIAHRGSEGEPYEMARTQDGWTQIPLAPPASLFQTNTWWAFGAEPGGLLFSAPDPLGSTREVFYARGEDGTYRRVGPIGEGDQAFNEIAFPMMSTADFSRLVYATGRPTWSFDQSTDHSVYEYSEGDDSEPQLVGVSGPAGSHDLISACGTFIGGGGGASVYNSLSADGRSVLFTAARCATGTGARAGVEVPAGTLYVRVDGERTVRISAPVASNCGAECQAAPPGDAFYEGASRDGSLVYFASTQQLTDEASEDDHPGDRAGDCSETALTATGCNLYLSICPEHCQDPSQRDLIDVSAGAKATGGPRVRGMAALSPDGSHAYFVAEGVLTEAPNREGKAAVEGAPNLYLYQRDEAHPQGQLSFVTQLAAADASNWRSGPGATGEGIGEPNITPDGRFLLFASRRELTPDAAPGAAQLYRYDAAAETMTRVSIGQQGFNDNGNSGRLDAKLILAAREFSLGNGPARANPSISDDGRFVFFQSPVALTPRALNEVQVGSSPVEYAENIYEWEADGAGGCHETTGCVSLLTNGLEAGEGGVVSISTPELLGADASGQNVFIAAKDPLTWQDHDTQRDYYDLRVGGGFAPPEEALPCQGDACKSGGTKGPAQPSPGSATFGGPEEGPHHTRPVKKHRKKHHGKKKHKRKKHRKHHHRPGGSK